MQITQLFEVVSSKLFMCLVFYFMTTRWQQRLGNGRLYGHIALLIYQEVNDLSLREFRV